MHLLPGQKTCSGLQHDYRLANVANQPQCYRRTEEAASPWQTPGANASLPSMLPRSKRALQQGDHHDGPWAGRRRT